MNELALQKYLVDSVNDAGGFAFKMSHRFLVGVPDILVQLPVTHWYKPSAGILPHVVRPIAGILEVKQREAVINEPRASSFKLDVSPQQKNFLARAAKGGMPVGVVSFIQRKGKGLKEVRMAVYTLTQMTISDYRATYDEHRPASTGDQVLNLLTGWHKEATR